MNTAATVEKLTKLRDETEKFLDALEKLADFYENDVSAFGVVLQQGSVLFGKRPWCPSTDPRPELSRMALAVDQHKGMAMLAVEKTAAYLPSKDGPINCAENWRDVFVDGNRLTFYHVQSTVLDAKSTLDAWIFEHEFHVESMGPPVNDLHPVVWSLAEGRWNRGSYADALKQVAQGLENHWKQRLNFYSETGHSFWASRIYREKLVGGGPKESKFPQLVYPCSGNADTNINNRDGMFHLALSLHKLSRNTFSHSTEDVDQTIALGYLISYSTLATMLDACEIHSKNEDEE
ncbi:hypothetical protein EAH68_00145 [Corynebacterium hylobatis]|uniref:Conserved hypothetical protein CHP02391 domain-containing protein n=1 Tax=Corynebacterium hylobatis TaxID=1859290 RepID=A0A430I1K9_9CORY|nr:TIGR02391 family protein [Corynebacterium hylobatis]RSZ66011.1 hypothetical protein EAH68_00145 [Corynebacterium hylobatis]